MKINLVREVYGDEDGTMDALPVESGDTTAPRTEAISTVAGLFEVLLKAPGRLDAFIREPGLQGKLIVGFAVIVVVGFTLYGLVMACLLFALPPEAVPTLLSPGWSRSWRSGAVVCGTFPLGLLLATGVCLPSYWYFALLGGARMMLSETLAHSLKGKAATTVLLAGVLPIYAIVLFGLIVVKAPAELLSAGIYLGVVLPFVLGMRGAQSLFSGFTVVVASLPAKERKRRYALPGWLVVVWAGLFTVTAPVILYKVWDVLPRL